MSEANVQHSAAKEDSSESVISSNNVSEEPSLTSFHSSHSSNVDGNLGELVYYGCLEVARNVGIGKLCDILFENGLNNQVEPINISNILFDLSSGETHHSKDCLKIINGDVYSCVIGTANVDLVINKDDSFLCLVCSNPNSADDDTQECHLFMTQTFDQMRRLVDNIFKFNNKNCGLPGNVELDVESDAEIKERDEGIISSHSWKSCPLVPATKLFKVRRNRVKRFLIALWSPSEAGKHFRITRCVGVVLAVGTTFSHGQSEKMDLKYTIYDRNGGIRILVETNVGRLGFIFGSPTKKGTNCPEIQIPVVMMSELVMNCLNEPFYLSSEFNIRLVPQNEKFMFVRHKSMREKYIVNLLRDYRSSGGYTMGDMMYHSSTEAISLMGLYRTEEGEDELEGSGSGKVVRGITNEGLFSDWSKLLREWVDSTWPIPGNIHRQLKQLCWRGIPDTMRCVVWQKLVGSQDVLYDAYRHLISKTSPYESVILRDIGRTYPGHRLFAEASGGQTSLMNIAKAYSIYDEQVGYCQGTSFLIAALLLHMPEEQAFVVFVNIMRRLGFSEIIINDFHGLNLLQWQLSRLLQTTIPNLHSHFTGIGLHAHMYTSQWFLTLFTAKFPLNMVFRILDVILCNGIDYLLNITLAILLHSRERLLQLDFEGIFSFFRMDLPRQFSTDSSCTVLLGIAQDIKITAKTLNRLKLEYDTIQGAESVDPHSCYKNEIANLRRENMRLECESEILTQELISCQFKYRSEVDELEARIHQMSLTATLMKDSATKSQVDQTLVNEELADLRNEYRAQLDKYAQQERNLQSIIDNCRHELVNQCSIGEQQRLTRDNLVQFIEGVVKSCEQCSAKLEENKTRSAFVEVDKGNIDSMCDRIRDLETSLIDTKLSLVESQCLNEDLKHQLQIRTLTKHGHKKL